MLEQAHVCLLGHWVVTYHSKLPPSLPVCTGMTKSGLNEATLRRILSEELGKLRSAVCAEVSELGAEMKELCSRLPPTGQPR